MLTRVPPEMINTIGKFCNLALYDILLPCTQCKSCFSCLVSNLAPPIQELPSISIV